MYGLKGKLHLYKCMHSDNTKFKMFIYTWYDDNMQQIILILTALYLPVLKHYQLCSNVNLIDSQYYLNTHRFTGNLLRCSRHHIDVENNVILAISIAITKCACGISSSALLQSII